MKRVRYRATIAYDGTAFAGYARQPDRITVEGVLRAALQFDQYPPSIAVAGRTDRGVHAVGQVISFRCPPSVTMARVKQAIVNAAPQALWCLAFEQASPRFHAQFSARFRRYTYFASAPQELDISRLNALLCRLQGQRCFSAFARDTPAGKSTIRTLIEARARHDGPSHVRFDFKANGFLRKQVRVLVATSLREALNKAPDDRLVHLADRGDRRETAHPANPNGLYLWRVGY